jgi:hypothetical protein
VITGRVVQPIIWKGHEIVAKGALVEGHLRPKRGENAVTIQLDRVVTNFGWSPFYARLTQVNPDGRAQIQVHADLEIPGVASIAFAGKTTELAAGTQLVWRTEPLFAAPKEAQAPGLNTSMGLR